MRQAIRSAIAADVIVVAGIGNRPNDTVPTMPAAMDGVVAVGAVDRNGNVAPITVTGPEMVLSAPGVDIYGADNINHGYGIGTGTSDATAIVAGTAALVRSKYPNLSAKDVIHRLTATATDRGAPGRDDQYGYGIVNPVAALTADVKPETAGQASTGPAVSGDPTASDRAAPAPLPRTGSATGILVVALVAAGLLAAVVGTTVVRKRQAAREGT